MLVVHRSKRGLPYLQKWFARVASPADLFGIVAYFQFLGERPPTFFKRKAFATVLIDLTQGLDAMLAGMHKNVRYEIRRAENDGLVWEAGVDPVVFSEYHEAFAKDKGIEGVDIGRLESFGEDLLLTRATCDGKTLAQHAYIVDRAEARSRFLYSSSGRFEGADGALVGRANRWCHWMDMLHLKEAGIAVYDLGGIAEGTDEPALLGINEFKLRFGGTMVREDHWLSPLYSLAARGASS